MNILYSSDNNYFNYAIASIVSLFENNTNNNIKLYFIDNNVSVDNIFILKSIVKKYKQHLVIIKLDNICINFELDDDFPKSAFARLFITHYINEDKILYLDCDTIITSDIAKLYSTDISEYYVAGVQDNVELIMKKIIGMSKNDRYINSGVLLINLSKWKLDNLEKKFIEFIGKFKGNVPHHDQGIINGVCKDKILILNPMYNFMSQFFIHNSHEMKKLSGSSLFYSDEELSYARDNIVVIHYIEKFYGRPWSKFCTHPLKGEFDRYLKMSSINFNKKDIMLKKSVKMRRFVYLYFPFFVYLFIEKILEIKRNYVIKRMYSCYEKKDFNY